MQNRITGKFNILYTTSFDHMMGGGQWSLYYLIKHLNKDRFHPIVVCPEEGELAERMRRIGAEVLCVDVGRIRYLNPLVIKKFISLIKDSQIALVHTDSSTETFYAGIAARIMRIPLIWHIRVNDREWFLDLILSLLSTRLILVCRALRSRFRWIKTSKKMIVVYNGIDLEEFDNFPITPSIKKKYDINQDELLIGCIGRLEQRKGQEYLTSAMRHIEHAKLVLVGGAEEEYRVKIKQICDDLNIADRVIHMGYRNDIPAVLKEVDIFVFPAISGEGFPRVILEAMAAGKPIVATDDAGNPEAVVNGRTGYIVPRKDTTALAEKIAVLVGDRRKRAVMGLAGRKRVEHFFTIQKNVDAIQRVYQAILVNKAP
jgi:glycosyltransferase involved in cell wall biosynthesis